MLKTAIQSLWVECKVFLMGLIALIGILAMFWPLLWILMRLIVFAWVAIGGLVMYHRTENPMWACVVLLAFIWFKLDNNGSGRKEKE